MKKVFYLMIGISLASAIGLQSCYYDKLNELKPNLTDACDTTKTPTYNANIKPILDSYNCTNASCHGVGSGNNVLLVTYADVKKVGGNDRLYGAIGHFDGFQAMPSDEVQIKQCEIDLIDLWIKNGMIEK